MPWSARASLPATRPSNSASPRARCDRPRATSTRSSADNFAFRAVDTANGAVRDITRDFPDAFSTIYPSSVTVGEAAIYSSSWFSNTIQVFDRETEALTAVWLDFALPQDMVELADGRLLVAELATGQLTLVSGADGETREAVVTDLAGPRSMAVGPDGAIYVADIGGTVTRIDPSDWSGAVVVEGLNGPEGIAFDPTTGKLVVSDAGARRIVRLDPATGAIAVLAADLPIGDEIPEGLPIWGRSDVAVGSDGTIYFSSTDIGIYRLSRQ